MFGARLYGIAYAVDVLDVVCFVCCESIHSGELNLRETVSPHQTSGLEEGLYKK